MIRVVLDPEVLVNCLLISEGLPARLREGWKNEDFVVCTSTQLLSEVEMMVTSPELRQSVTISDEEIREFLETIPLIGITPVEPPTFSPVTGDRVADLVLSTAAACSANLIVGENPSLLARKKHGGATIMSTREFFRAINETMPF